MKSKKIIRRKKILIIGGTGFIGFHLCKYFLKKKMLVFSISLSKPKRMRRLKKVRYLIADISNEKKLSIIKKFDFNYVINCGGYVDHYNKTNTYNSHYRGLRNIVEIVKKKGIKTFVQIGSSTEYGNTKSPQKENFKCNPKTIYAKSKLQATEFLLEENKSSKFPSVILRFYQVYGPHQDNNRFIAFIINSCIENKIFPCSMGKQFRDFLYVDDAVQAISRCLDNKKVYGKIINVGFGDAINLKKIINSIRTNINKGYPKYGKIKMRKDEVMTIFPKITEAKKKLKWKPKISFKNGLIKTINFYKRNNLVYLKS